MQFTANDLIYTIDMEDRTVHVSEGFLSARNVTHGFDFYSAEDCATPEEVRELIEDHISETSA